MSDDVLTYEKLKAALDKLGPPPERRFVSPRTFQELRRHLTDEQLWLARIESHPHIPDGLSVYPDRLEKWARDIFMGPPPC